MKWINGIFFCLVILLTRAEAQTLPSVTFKTPEVAAFNRFIETPVSYYTGVPNISIPLYEIKIKGVTVPITLDYHAGGIRVDQDATWVGLGWSLSYGGEISRKTKGAPDENYYYTGGINNRGLTIDEFNNLAIDDESQAQVRLENITAAKYNRKDYMPDEFYYNILGMGGRFMYSQKQNKFILFPKEDILVAQYDNNNTLNGAINPFNYWNLKLPDGTSVDLGKDGTITDDPLSVTPAGAFKSAWNVKTIRNIFNDSINYTYEKFNYINYRLSGLRVSLFQSSVASGNMGRDGFYDNLSNSAYLSGVRYYDARPSSITYPEGKVDFLTTSRNDAPSRALNEINVTNQQGKLIRKIRFYYSYFYADAFDRYINNESIFPSEYRFQRLRLDSIAISGSDNTAPVKYKFDYYVSQDMPSKFTYSQDHWGFYNGAANTSQYSFIPNIAPDIFTGGDRSVHSLKANVFSIKSITYPEGGKSEFVYEGNTAGIWNMPVETYQDDNTNIAEKSAAIGISSYSRSTSYPSPDYVNGSGGRCFTKTFVVENGVQPAIGYGWECSTNFGISDLEKDMPPNVNNVNFLLEKLDAGRYVSVREFNTAYYQGSVVVRKGEDKQPLSLTPGSYKITVTLSYGNQPGSPPDNQPYNLSFIVKWRQVNTGSNMVNVGGLRIKDINYYDNDGKLAKKKSYTYLNPYAYPANPNFTSGRVVSFPQYFQYNFKYYPQTTSSGGGIQAQMQWGINFYSNSVLPLETTSGSYCGYEYVDEYTVDNTNPDNNQRIGYKFSFAMPYFSQYYQYNYHGIIEPQEWTRGKLLETKYYKGDKVVKKDSISYYDWSPHLNDISEEDYVQEINTNLISFQYLNFFNRNTALPEDFYDNAPPSINYDDYPNFNRAAGGVHCVKFNFGAVPSTVDFAWPYLLLSCQPSIYVKVPYFIHNTGFNKPKTKTVITFDDAGNSIQENEAYYYEKTPLHYQLTQTAIINSKKDTLKQKNQYAADFGSLLPYSAMVQRNMVNSVVSTSSYKNSTFLQSLKANYKDWGNNIFMPVSSETQTAGFATEQRMNFEGYDSKGNLLGMSQSGGVTTAYLWGYKGLYPVARIEGADYNTVKTYITQSILDNPLSDQQLRDEINNLRAKLPNTLITTYTYMPSIGITSETSPANRTTFYEYDGLGRLRLIKDQNGKILKQFDYQYQKPINQ
ncbi:hypothetical protein [Chitinophaga ginsengisegetis]|uniref:hypothetical protein n=1 Tax=Chitinophaga ginsengisegetis TaxID=393003 RepID=UPI000DB9D6AE|nr:hypothetical protein [Chitinophaga ginsengisegetis]MDR6568839.1 YD repeat-containing protein [Chitinophaga ginsengisegetis]MDR6649131.1 YD repeat-containing protein [Chitinophaga ginsengisegetis]MDR6654920.1 YD repeat-containing protein [Chitinophaga ginsengisegetis]